MVKNQPANAGNMGSIPVQGRTSSAVRQRLKIQILQTGKLVRTVISQ